MIDTIFLEMRPTVVQVFVLVIMKLLNQTLVSSFFSSCVHACFSTVSLMSLAAGHSMHVNVYS